MMHEVHAQKITYNWWGQWHDNINVICVKVSVRAMLLYFVYNLSHATFHTQMHIIFEVLYLIQFLMDSLKSWSVHFPICNLDVWYIILPNIIQF